MNRNRSQALWERSRNSLAGGVSSNVRATGHPSIYFERGEGSRLYDVDGNVYVDYVLGQGPMILGHAPRPVIEAVKRAVERGQLYAGQHELEVNLSEKLQQLIPCAERVRYCNSGSEAVQAALRVARAYTGRQKIVKFEGHYHGWFDNVLVSVSPPLDAAGPRESPKVVLGSAGQSESVRDEIVVLPWNDLSLITGVVEAHAGEIAAVIMEPIMCNTGCILPQEGYLDGVQRLCTHHGIVLIFDEIITGFRLGTGGAQGYLGVTPDLATFGKAMANGFPISCLAGKRELMELIATQKVNHSGTYNSNVVCMAAAWATVCELERDERQTYGHLNTLGRELMQRIQELAARLGITARVQGPGPMFHVAFTRQDSIVDYRTFLSVDQERYRQFTELLLDEGVRVLGRGLWYLSSAHTFDDIELTLHAVESACVRLLDADPLFRQS